MKNKELVKEFIEKMIEVGSEIASQNYMIIVLSSALTDVNKEFPFIKNIKITGEGTVIIDSKLDEVIKEDLATPLNKVYDYLFLDNSKKLLKEKVNDEVYKEFEDLGLHV